MFVCAEIIYDLWSMCTSSVWSHKEAEKLTLLFKGVAVANHPLCYAKLMLCICNIAVNYTVDLTVD